MLHVCYCVLYRDPQDNTITCSDPDSECIFATTTHFSSVSSLPMVESDEILPGDMPLLYRDPKLLAVSKPAFLRMGGEFSDTVSSRLKAEHGLTDATIKTVHQLDYATSGVLVTATQKQSAAVLTSLFQERLSKKAYVALVELPDSGKFFPSLSEASLPAVYGRESLEQGKKMAAVRPETAEKPNSTASSSASFEAAARSGPEHVL